MNHKMVVFARRRTHTMVLLIVSGRKMKISPNVPDTEGFHFSGFAA